MDDFYVGYHARAPYATAAWIRRVVLAMLSGIVLLALVLVFTQNPFAASSFEFGVTRTFAGVVHETPVPSVDLGGGEHALLVAPGKHGAATLIHGLDLKSVALQGSRIQRGRDLMIEVAPGSIRVAGNIGAERPNWIAAGRVSLLGEIVDSKCYLGVMNPGEGKVHRDCAARCISGGIPPALIAADRDGGVRFFLLTGRGGVPINKEVLPVVGEPVRLVGTLFRWRDQVRIEADAGSIRPLE